MQAIQLSKGQTKKGGEFPYYSPASVQKFGKREGPWTLHDTGALYLGLQIKNINEKGFETTSTSKTASLVLGKLQKKGYKSTDVFGLNEETRKGSAENPRLTEILLPQVILELEKQTGLKI